jgi:hypothetical protein
VKRANQVLERERERIDKLAETAPFSMAQKLRKSLEETTKDVENIKKEIKRKKKDIHRSLKHYV